MGKNIMGYHWTKQQVVLLLICLVLNANATDQIGHVEKIGSLNCYVSGPQDSKVSVLMASDIFGYQVPHLRQLADKVGAAGFYTVVPDFFDGDPYVSGVPTKPYSAWIPLHPSYKGITYAEEVIEALKCRGITKIGAAGFCWGGKVVADLTKSSLDIQAAVLLHPSGLTLEDIQGNCGVPISISGGQNDTLIPPSLIEQYRLILNSMPKIDSFVKIVPGAEHGWTTRYDDRDAVAVERATETHNDMLNWFTKYVNVTVQEGVDMEIEAEGPSSFCVGL